MTSERAECPARFRAAPTGATTLVVHTCARRSSIAARSLPVITVANVSSSAAVTALIVVLPGRGTRLYPVAGLQE